MSNNLPAFIPQQIPKFAVLDLSKSLPDTSLDELNRVASSVSYSPKVVVLPTNYHCPDLRELTLGIAKRWNVDGEGKTLLIIIDLKGHNVRIHGSPELNEAGVTSNYISNTLVPRQFVPYMRQGDLTSAIRLTLLDASRVQTASSQQNTERTLANTTEYQSAQPMSLTTGSVSIPAYPDYTSLTVVGLLISFVCSIVLTTSILQRNRNKAALQDLKVRLDSLYSRVSELGQASDFLDPSKDAALAHEIADFFAKLGTLEKAQGQVELLTRSLFKVGAAEAALKQCDRYAAIMERTVDDLLKRVNARTGGITSYEPDSKIAAAPDQPKPVQAAVSVSRNDLSTPRTTVYLSPRWIKEPVYSRSIDDDGLGYIASYFADTSRSYGNEVSSVGSSGSRRSSDGSGFWGSSSQSGSSHSSSEGRSSSSDGGGSWSDSGSSTSSSDGASSDGGGSW